MVYYRVEFVLALQVGLYELDSAQTNNDVSRWEKILGTTIESIRIQ